MLNYRARIVDIGILLLIFSSCAQNHEEKYFQNGELQYIVEIKDGVWNGEFKEYYKTGELFVELNYVNGEPHGKEIIYNKNGNINQVLYWDHGRPTGKWEFYYPDGSVREHRFFNDEGNIYNYIMYDKEGKQEKSEHSKKAIILNSTDTLIKGQEYSAEVRLGNRNFNNFEVYVREPGIDSIFYSTPFEKKPEDFYTVMLELDTDTFDIGKNVIEGAILEYDTIKRDTFNIIRFKREIFILKDTNQVSLNVE